MKQILSTILIILFIGGFATASTRLIQTDQLSSDVVINADIDTLAELNALMGEDIASTTQTWADAYVEDNITVTGYMQDGDIDTLTELEAWLTDVTELATSSGTYADMIVGKATALETARTIAGVSFDGTANISIPSTGLSDTADLLYEAELDSLSELNAQLAGVTSLASTSATLSGATIDDDLNAITNIDGENIKNDTIDNDSIDWADMADLTTDGAVSWSNLAEGELAMGVVVSDDIKDGTVAAGDLADDYLTNAEYIASTSNPYITDMDSLHRYWSFRISTSTLDQSGNFLVASATGTLEFLLPAVTVTKMACDLNASTLGMRIGDGTNWAEFKNFTTTASSQALSTNNSFTDMEGLQIEAQLGAVNAVAFCYLELDTD